MFNFSFYELMTFGIIALIVLGPEKLPQAVRTIGTYYSKFRRTIGTLKAEMEAELDLAETRQLMQQELAKIRESEAEMQRQMAQLRGSMQQFKQQQDAPMQSLPSESSGSEDTLEKQERYSIAGTPTASDEGPDNNANPSDTKDRASMPSAKSETSLESEQDNQFSSPITRPWENMWFLLGDYDRVRRLPPAPFLPNYTANPLLYDMASSSAKLSEVGP